MQEAWLEEAKEYVLRRHNMVAHYIATRPIIDFCEEAVWRPGTWVGKIWWEQEGLDLEGEWEAEEADEEETEEADGYAEGVVWT